MKAGSRAVARTSKQTSCVCDCLASILSLNSLAIYCFQLLACDLISLFVLLFHASSVMSDACISLFLMQCFECDEPSMSHALYRLLEPRIVMAKDQNVRQLSRRG